MKWTGRQNFPGYIQWMTALVYRYCRLCKCFNTWNEQNGSAVFNSTRVSLHNDVPKRHTDSSMHKVAVHMECEQLSSVRTGGIVQAFSEAISTCKMRSGHALEQFTRSCRQTKYFFHTWHLTSSHIIRSHDYYIMSPGLHKP